MNSIFPSPLDKTEWVDKKDSPQKELDHESKEFRIIAQETDKFFEAKYRELLRQDRKQLQMWASKGDIQSKISIHLAFIENGRMSRPNTQNFFIGVQVQTPNLTKIKHMNMKMPIFSEVVVSDSDIKVLTIDTRHETRRDVPYPMTEEMKAGMNYQFLRVLETIIPERITHTPQFLGTFQSQSKNNGKNIIAELFDRQQGFFFAKFKLNMNRQTIEGYRLENLQYQMFDKESSFFGLKKLTFRQEIPTRAQTMLDDDKMISLRDESAYILSKIKTTGNKNPPDIINLTQNEKGNWKRHDMYSDHLENPDKEIKYPLQKEFDKFPKGRAGGDYSPLYWPHERMLWDLDTFQDGSTLDHNLQNTWQYMNENRQEFNSHHNINKQILQEKLTNLHDQLGTMLKQDKATSSKLDNRQYNDEDQQHEQNIAYNLNHSENIANNSNHSENKQSYMYSKPNNFHSLIWGHQKRNLV